MVRKKPIRHVVRSYVKEDGSRVSQYPRGSGVKTHRPGKVVGAEGSVRSIPGIVIDGAVGAIEKAITGIVADDIRKYLKSNPEVEIKERPKYHLEDVWDPRSLYGRLQQKFSMEQLINKTAREGYTDPEVYVDWASEWVGDNMEWKK